MYLDDRRQRQGGFGLAAVAVVLAALLGTALGEAVGPWLGEGLLHDLVAGPHPFGFDPTRFDFWVLDATLGCHVHVNAVGLGSALLAVLLLRRA